MSRTGGRVRPERVAEQIRIEVASILQKDVKDPRIRLATCTRVQVSGDLRVAKVYVSVFADKDEQRETLQALERASGYFRRLLGERLGLRVSPEVRFLFDPSVEFGIQLDELLDATRPSDDDDDQEPRTDR